MTNSFPDFLLGVTKSAYAIKTEVLQELWSGYGEICRYRLTGSPVQQVIVKQIQLQPVDAHPRNWNSTFGHKRKLKSYEVERNWYTVYSPLCKNQSFKLPEFLGSFKEGNTVYLVLEDLSESFPLLLTSTTLHEALLCVKWLASFHAYFLNQKPNQLWEKGSYWHLETRPEELEKIESDEIRLKAKDIDEKLNTAKHKTIIHGDAKLANFCFSSRKDKVAAVDFQYVGGGCGMKDLIYFMSSVFTAEECKLYESTVLDFYFEELRENLKKVHIGLNKQDLLDLEQEWRGLYTYAWADFTRFLLGWMPNHQKVHTYSQQQLDSALKALNKMP